MLCARGCGASGLVGGWVWLTDCVCACFSTSPPPPSTHPPIPAHPHAPIPTRPRTHAHTNAQALYDGQYIDAHFTRSFYKHMLGQVRARCGACVGACVCWLCP